MTIKIPAINKFFAPHCSKKASWLVVAGKLSLQGKRWPVLVFSLIWTDPSLLSLYAVTQLFSPYNNDNDNDNDDDDDVSIIMIMMIPLFFSSLFNGLTLTTTRIFSEPSLSLSSIIRTI